MAWQVGDLGDCYEEWAARKSQYECLRLLDGLMELADLPLNNLPGQRRPGWSPMYRWAIIDSTFGPTFVFIRVYESQGIFDVIDLQDVF